MRRPVILLLIGLLLPATALAKISKEEAISQFVQGNISYKEGDYARAIEKYEVITSKGKASGPLYYNLANAYYRQGNLGKAILNYERAKRQMPRDGDLNFNYNYIRAKANLFEGTIGVSFLQKALNNHLAFYSLEEMLLISTGLIIFFGIIHLLFLYLPWPLPIRNGLIAVIIILGLAFIPALTIKARQEANTAIILTKTETRFEPRDDATAHYQVLEGSSVRIMKEEGDWAKVKRSDGKEGWIRKTDLERI